jgi:hypothetical protein
MSWTFGNNWLLSFPKTSTSLKTRNAAPYGLLIVMLFKCLYQILKLFFTSKTREVTQPFNHKIISFVSIPPINSIPLISWAYKSLSNIIKFCLISNSYLCNFWMNYSNVKIYQIIEIICPIVLIHIFVTDLRHSVRNQIIAVIVTNIIAVIVWKLFIILNLSRNSNSRQIIDIFIAIDYYVFIEFGVK